MVEYVMTGGRGEGGATKEEWEEAQRISMKIQGLRDEDDVDRSELKAGSKTKK